MKKKSFLAFLVFGALLSACGKQTTLQPITLSTQQQQLFEQSCKTCHSNPSNPAPQIGDKAAWDKRLEQGLPTLVQHAVQGFNAMPAGGLCTTCTPPDFEAMIVYMATAQTAK